MQATGKSGACTRPWAGAGTRVQRRTPASGSIRSAVGADEAEPGEEDVVSPALCRAEQIETVDALTRGHDDMKFRLEALQDALNNRSLTSEKRSMVGRLIEDVSADHDRFVSMKAMF